MLLTQLLLASQLLVVVSSREVLLVLCCTRLILVILRGDSVVVGLRFDVVDLTMLDRVWLVCASRPCDGHAFELRRRSFDNCLATRVSDALDSLDTRQGGLKQFILLGCLFFLDPGSL